jgi:hypothetical protein
MSTASLIKEIFEMNMFVSDSTYYINKAILYIPQT